MNIQTSIFDDRSPQREPEPAAKPPPPPSVAAASTCQSCGAPILWMSTITGRPSRIALDDQIEYIAANGSGKRLMLFDLNGKVINGFKSTRNAAGALAGRRTHFATCPDADQFRHG